VPLLLHTNSTQTPSTQLSPGGQVIGVYTHPEPASQVSVVQRSPSSQVMGSFWQTPPTQESAVHASESSQSIGVLLQVPPTQSSIVQGSPSSQSAGTEHCGPTSASVFNTSMRP
jgi:hypothetical protein